MAVALALRVVGVADNVEFLATLLVAPVIAATLLVDRNLGYVVAGVAAVAYLYLRFDDIQNAGAVGVVILVLFRAGSYGGVAYVTPLLFARLSGVSDVDIGVPARHLRAEPVDPGASRPGGSDWADSGDRWAAEAAGADTGYAAEPADTYAESYGDTYADASVAAVAEAPRSPWSDEAPHDAWSTDAVGRDGRQHGAPVPRVPTGWIDDATSPLGDETIPVGYTGELFLGRITGSVPVVPTNGARNGSGARPGGHGSVPSSAPPAGANGSTARPGYADTEPLRPLEPAGPVDLGLSARRPADADADAGATAGAGAARPGYADTEPLRSLEPAGPVDLGLSTGRPTETDWSSRAGMGSGENPSPWRTRADADQAWDTTPPRGGNWVDPRPSGATPAVSFPPAAPSYGGPAPEPPPPSPDPSAGVDPETRLWNAPFFRDRLNSAIARSQASASPFSVVMIQVADEPFQPLPYRRQVALLRELGHQFVPRFVDHLVHLPDGVQHWFAVVLDDTDSTAARSFERRLRTTLAGYLRSRGLRIGDLQSASLTSPDDDDAMATIWASLLGADNVGA